MVNILGYEAGWEDLGGPMVWGTKAAWQVAKDPAKEAWGEITGNDASGGGGGGNAQQIVGALDPRAYQYGGSPEAAAAAQNAISTGNAGIQVGQMGIDRGNAAAAAGESMYGARMAGADYFNGRAAQQGNWGAQNATLSQLGGLEARQGPSASQAQLMDGTNQAMAGQLALARSGRGFGGNAAAMGQAQGNMAGIQANQANQAAMLRAQEDAAWRQRQAANLGNVAGFQGQQSQADLGAAVQSRGQNDAMANNMIGYGQDAYFRGNDAAMAGYGTALGGVNASLQGQNLGNQINLAGTSAQQAGNDALLRAWAAEKGFALQEDAARAQQNAALIGAGASLAANYGSGGAYGAYQAGTRGGNR